MSESRLKNIIFLKEVIKMQQDSQTPIEEFIEFNFETMLKAIPLIVGFFIICGSLYLETYYSCFQINIFNYLDTSEILTAFLYLTQELIFVFAIAAGYTLVIKAINWLDKKFKKSKPEVQKPSGFVSNIDTISFGMILVALLICLFYIYKSFTIQIDSKYIIKNRDWMRYVLWFFTIIGTLILTRQVEKDRKKGVRSIIYFSLLFFVSFSVSSAVSKIESTVNNVDLSAMVIRDKDTLRTTNNYVYVGRTNNYVFFFETDKKIADVIPQGVIKQITFRYTRP
ncbi:MAG: hypothetical protein K0S32_2477 [Bacteroidetes bacterium]|nr:hypothetical protein [Bacteroidota bacterium]